MRGCLLLLVLSVLALPAMSQSERNPALTDPAKADLQAPDAFRVKFETTKGDFTIRMVRDWSPNGVDRFYNLVKIGYFKDIAFYRVISGFMAQFGFHGDPAVNQAWTEATIVDDPVKVSNTRGRFVFAKGSRPNSRSTQFYILMEDRLQLDNMGFAPIGEIEGDGLQVINSLYAGYGECQPMGRGPHQGRIHMSGNEYLKKQYPELDYVKNVSILED